MQALYIALTDVLSHPMTSNIEMYCSGADSPFILDSSVRYVGKSLVPRLSEMDPMTSVVIMTSINGLYCCQGVFFPVGLRNQLPSIRDRSTDLYDEYSPVRSGEAARAAKRHFCTIAMTSLH